jgi:NAD(P)-dependent dehydrogenase (short-subunit alcohol dehydrogenase family)
MQHLNGQIALVTGATAGIGLVTARRLAEHGAEVCLVGRDAGRLSAAEETIRRAVTGARVFSLRADLSLIAEQRRVAAEFLAARPRLDVLVNNAGAIFASREETADGLERTFALNHLSYFTVTNALMPALRAAPRARIVSVASAAHRQARLDFDDLQSRRGYVHMRVYGTSKLMNILFTRALARRLTAGATAGKGAITANCLHPGFVATNFADNNGGFLKALVGVGKTLFAINEERGADTSVFLATDPTVAEVTGEYFAKCRPAGRTSAARDDAAADRLWAESERIVGPIDGGL